MGIKDPSDIINDPQIAERARQAQNELVARSALRSVPFNIVNAILLSFLIYPYADTLEHAIWLSALIIVPLLRLGTMYRARRADRAPTSTEMNIYGVLSGIVGVAWGMTPFLAGPDVPIIVAQIIALVIAGMSAGAVLTSAGERRVIWAYTVPALGLWALSLVIHDVQLGLMGALMLAGFFGAMSLLARTYTLTLTDAVTANIALDAARKKSEEQAEALARLAEHNDKAARRAEDAARSSAVMLANMSHELRSPLNGVLGMSQLLAETSLNDDQRRMINRVRESGENLEGLINTVLEVSRIDAGRMELVIEDLTARDLTQRIRREAAPQAKSRDIEFDVQVAGEADRPLRADGKRIMHMCRVIVNNALSFTEKGAITVCVTTAFDLNGVAKLRVEVRDTGSGVPESSRDQLFTAMSADRVDPTIKEAGTGLGLYLVRKLAEMMNGQAGYRPSEFGDGSVFWFELSLRASMKADRYADGEQMAVASRRLRVLVGECDPARRSVLLGYLKSFNCVVTCASSGYEMVDALGASAYDAVVLGHELQDCEPEDASADVRALASTAAMTPVLRLSEHLDVALRVNAVETLVRSPVSADNLLDALRKALANDASASAQLYRIA